MRAGSLAILLFLARAWSCGSAGTVPEVSPTVIREKQLSAEEQMLVKKGFARLMRQVAVEEGEGRRLGEAELELEWEGEPPRRLIARKKGDAADRGAVLKLPEPLRVDRRFHEVQFEPWLVHIHAKYAR